MERRTREVMDTFMKILEEEGGQVKQNELVDQCKYSGTVAYNVIEQMEEYGDVDVEWCLTDARKKVVILKDDSEQLQTGR